MKYYNDILIAATKLHYGQTRKDNITPYIFHPINVSMQVKNVLDKYSDETEFKYMPVYASLLHDVIEDTGITSNELYYIICTSMMHIPNYHSNRQNRNDIAAIASRIVNNVLFLTRENLTGIGRHAMTKIYLNNIISGGYEPILIKLCDRIDNIKTLKSLDNLEFKERYIEDTIQMLPVFNTWIITHQCDENCLYEGVVEKMKELNDILDKL